ASWAQAFNGSPHYLQAVEAERVHVQPLPRQRMDPRQRWRQAAMKAQMLARALQLPDPWESYGLKQLPLEHAQRRRWDPTRKAWVTSDVLVRFEKEPFAKGSMRVCHRMRREPDCSNWVAKRYISDPDLTVLESDVIMQMIAKSYGDRFNACSPPKKVDFVEASVLAVLERPGQRRDFAVEAFLDGSFTKHSSNSGFVADEVVRNTPHAFSHYTFEASAGEQIVVDIQGVDDLYTDPQIHTATSSASFGRGNMGIRGIALFFASHRCNSVCHQLGLTPFAHSPMPGDGAATEYGRDVDAAPDEDVVIRAEPSSLVLAVGKGNNSRAEIYRHVHFALAMLHARHVQVNAEFIGHNVLTSPAQGLFHLQVSAQLGSIPGALALACLHLSIRPRKGVLRALGTSLQRPLTLDESAAFPYILQAAESGVAKAMAAAAYAYERGLGCAVSATDAVFWYRKALTALSTQEDDTEEDREAERLPGGSLEQSEILRALAHLYELGGGGLAPNPRLAWQFQVLSNNRARLESADSGEESSPMDEGRVAQAADRSRVFLNKPGHPWFKPKGSCDVVEFGNAYAKSWGRSVFSQPKASAQADRERCHGFGCESSRWQSILTLLMGTMRPDNPSHLVWLEVFPCLCFLCLTFNVSTRRTAEAFGPNPFSTFVFRSLLTHLRTMAHSSLGLVCAMALAVLCSARRSNQGWGWGGKAEDKLQTEDPKPEDPKPGWVDWAAVAEKAKATGMSMKDAAVGMGVYAKETAEDIPWNDIAEQAKQYGDNVKDAASKVEWEKWAAQAKQYGDTVKDAASKVEWEKWAAQAKQYGDNILFIASGEEGFLASLVFNVAMFLDADTYGPTKCKESADPA
ncbi:Eef2k, partial [Symbiodinium sp. KB8]